MQIPYSRTWYSSSGLFSESDGKPCCFLKGHRGGITHLSFASDGILLYSGARMDSEILCWDLRNPGCVLYSFPRAVSTNQRIYFDLSACSTYVLSGESQQELWLCGRGPQKRTMPHKTKHKKTVDFVVSKKRVSPVCISFCVSFWRKWLSYRSVIKKCSLNNCFYALYDYLCSLCTTRVSTVCIFFCEFLAQMNGTTVWSVRKNWH